ncbi:MAG: helix-turn-helix domain-containing protein [Oscillospiraceae bacterium]|nr:helix-turn-helix domain-containing protein [Oscillospiraceae bacterium]
MLTFDLLTTDFDTKLKAFKIGFADFGKLRGTLFPDDDNAPDPDYLNIVDYEHLQIVLRDKNDYSDCIFFCSDLDGRIMEMRDSLPFPYAVFACRIGRLANIMQRRISDYREYGFQLLSVRNVDELVSLLGKTIGKPVCIVNSFFQKIYADFGNEDVRGNIFRQLKNGGNLFYADATFMMNTERDRGDLPCIVFEMEDACIADYQLRHNNKNAARVLIELGNSSEIKLIEPYISDFFSAIRPIIFADETLRKQTQNNIEMFFTDIIDMQLSDTGEIKHRLELIPEIARIKDYYPIVLSFGEQNYSVPYNYLSGQLEALVPGSVVTTYNDRILMIVPTGSEGKRLDFDLDAFGNLLERFNAVAGVGPQSSHLASIRPLYIETSSATRLGKVFRKDPNQRIFDFDDFRMYFYVDLCVEAAVKNQHFSTLAYLCCPKILPLYLYDSQNGTELSKTLNTYLELDCNATLCAEKLFVHRNTVNYRINSIEQILGRSLDDVSYREQLRFSLNIVEYMVKYLNYDVSGEASKWILPRNLKDFIPMVENPKNIQKK